MFTLTESNKEKFETLQALFLGITPAARSLNVKDFPTYEELLQTAKQQSDSEECQLSFISGYLKASALLFGNIAEGKLSPTITSKNIPYENILLNLTIEEKRELANAGSVADKNWYNLSIEFNDRTSGTISLISRSTSTVSREYDFTNNPDNSLAVNLRKLSAKITALSRK